MAWISIIKITVASSTAFVVVRGGGGEMAAAAGTLWKFYSAPRKNHYISKKKPRGTIHFVLRITASVVGTNLLLNAAMLDMQFLLGSSDS